MELSEQRSGFRARLKQALAESQLSHLYATGFAREFNARYSGNPITINTARKWLLGEAIPTQEKLQAMAGWLDVRTEWLRFGSGAQRIDFGTANRKQFDQMDRQTLKDLSSLDAHHRLLAREFVKLLIRDMSPR